MERINWTYYFIMKQMKGHSSEFFSFEDWEIDFAISEISKIHVDFDEISILKVILDCCESFSQPYSVNYLFDIIIHKLNKKPEATVVMCA